MTQWGIFKISSTEVITPSFVNDAFLSGFHDDFDQHLLDCTVVLHTFCVH